MKELQELIKRIEVEINKTPSGELRNLLCDANILLQKQALILPIVSNQRELFICSFCKSEQTYLSEGGYVRTCLTCDKTARVN